MPDVKPRPRAGAIRLSLMSADQKGTGSASILTIVVGIPAPCLNMGEITRPALCLQQAAADRSMRRELL
jgi:hypothetical protein